MKTISTTNARKHISQIVETVKETGDVYIVGRRNRPEVLIIKFPAEYSPQHDEITNINTYSESFAFLETEPDLYSVDDIKKSYV